MALQTSVKWTYDEYLLLPEDDGKRYEIIDGELFVNAAPNLRHQRIQVRIGNALVNFVETHNAGEVFYAPVDVLFSDVNVVQPDLLFLKALAPDDAVKLEITPDLVIEILSIGNRKKDEIVKLKLYDTFAVSEYWIVDPEIELVKIYRRVEGRLARVEEIGLDGQVTTPLLPGFALAARKIFT